MSNKYQEWLDTLKDTENWEWDDWSHNSWNQALEEILKVLIRKVDIEERQSIFQYGLMMSIDEIKKLF